MATPQEALESKRSLLEERLGSSRTAYAPRTAPTSSDLRLSSQLASVNQQIDRLQSEQIRNKWYGPSDAPAEEAGEHGGFIIKGLKALQQPLNVIAGTAQYALGKGSKPSLVANIEEARKKGLVMGDILKQYGAPRGVQVPLGFALDVMFDPINWATAGTAALIPRVGGGLAKGLRTAGVSGAIKAGGAGLTSGVQRKAAIAARMVPFAKKSTKYAEFTEGLGKKAIAGSEKYDELMGIKLADKLGKLPYLPYFGRIPAGTVGRGIENIIRGKTVVPGLGFLGKEVGTVGGEIVTRGDTIADFFKYSTKQAAEIADERDRVWRLRRDEGIISPVFGQEATFKSIDDYLKPDAKITLADKVNETAETFIRGADGVVKPELIAKATVEDSFENAKKLLEIAKEDFNMQNLMKAYKVTPPGKTGVQWFDNAIEKFRATTVDDIFHRRLGDPKVLDVKPTPQEMEQGAEGLIKTLNSYDKVKDMKPLNKILGAYPEVLSIFKFFKVPLNFVGAHFRATIGNLSFGAMMGLPVHSKAYLKELRQGAKLASGKMTPQGFKDMFFNDFNSWIDFMDNHPYRFRQMTGIDVDQIYRKLEVGEDLKQYFSKTRKVLEEAFTVADVGIIEKSFSNPKLLREFEELVASLKDDPAKLKELMKSGYGKVSLPSETVMGLTRAGKVPLRLSDEASSFLASEVYSNRAVPAMVEYLRKAGETSDAAKILHAVVNSMPKWYERIDQSWKIGTTSFLTKVGLTEQQLLAVGRNVPMNMSDVLEPVIKGGEKFYRLTPLKASEVAMEAYMNYAAMPDFVRVMRATPVAGVPFLSFQYAMAAKAGKTIINNPAAFNKIGFILNEMNVDRSPQDKAALEEKYNTYLKSPTVMKMFGMWNTDVKDLVPYYTMNMFNPSEKRYDDSFRSQLMKRLDQVPAFQDPFGQVFKDYILQPWVLSGSGQAPQGMFGQPLYPSYDEKGKKIDVGIGTKAFYGGRTIAEAFVPGMASALGLPLGLTGMPPGATEYIPSYGIRNILNAVQGRTSLGAKGKEHAGIRTLRSVLGRSGLPVYTLDPTRTKTK